MDMRIERKTEEPLTGVRVLVTRAGKAAAPLRLQLEALGATVIELPAIAIEPVIDSTALQVALSGRAEYDWIVFTSRNAVEAVFNLPSVSADEPWPQLAAVGPSTAAELAERGLAVTCVPDDASASGLVTALRRFGLAGKRVLLPVGDLARPELRLGMESEGAQVDEIQAYRTVQPRETRREALDALRRGAVDVIALASPSAFRNLLTMLGTQVTCLQFVRLVCIGPTTAAAVCERQLEPAAVAGEHTIPGLVAAVADLYR
jgi:uroporphyrinogen-III synthase